MFACNMACTVHPYGFEEAAYTFGDFEHVLSLARQVEDFHKSQLAELHRTEEQERHDAQVQQEARNEARRAWLALLPHPSCDVEEAYQHDAHQVGQVGQVGQVDRGAFQVYHHDSRQDARQDSFADKVVEAQVVVVDNTTLGKPSKPTNAKARVARDETKLGRKEVYPKEYPRLVRVGAKANIKKKTAAKARIPAMRPTMRTPLPRTIASEELRAATWIARFAPRTNKKCLCELAHISMRTLSRYVEFSCREDARDYNIFFGRAGKTKLGMLDRLVVRYTRQISVHPRFKQFLLAGPELAPQMYAAMMAKYQDDQDDNICNKVN